LLRQLNSASPELGQAIRDSLDLTEDTETKLTAAINNFKATFS
jgi:F0F1-type ATP synthase alpha subunit